MSWRHHLQRLFLPIPDPQGRAVIWIHAVSVGEARAVKVLFRHLRDAHPHHFFLVTTTTKAGLAEARRSLSDADAFSYLPLDIGWIVRRWTRKLCPKLFLLVETDFWPNLLASLKKQGTKTILVSGKLSKRSACRFAFFHPFSKKLFGLFDLLCVQNKEHWDRFFPVSDSGRLHITGNLKLDHRPEPVNVCFWKNQLALPDPVITVACTHAPEEELLLDLLSLPSVFLCLAPRHPERFEEAASILRKRSVSFFRWTRLNERKGGERVLLIDAMGQLPICYSLSRLAIVAGSFTSKIGGHNVIEPCLYGTPVFFGPYMFSQKELESLVLTAGAGMQVSHRSLLESVEKFLATPRLEESMRAAVRTFAEAGSRATAETLRIMNEHCSLT